MIVTKRDQELEVKELIKEAMNGVDWAISQGLQPSWNAETNKQATAITNTKQPELQEECPKCGSKLGVSKKGNKYCLAKCWLKE